MRNREWRRNMNRNHKARNLTAVKAMFPGGLDGGATPLSRKWAAGMASPYTKDKDTAERTMWAEFKHNRSIPYEDTGDIQ